MSAPGSVDDGSAVFCGITCLFITIGNSGGRTDIGRALKADDTDIRTDTGHADGVIEDSSGAACHMRAVVVGTVILHGVVVIVIEVPADDVVDLAVAVIVNSVSAADGSGCPVDGHGHFALVDPDVVHEVGMVPFDAGIGNADQDVVSARYIIPGVIHFHHAQCILLADQRIVGNQFAAHDGIEFGKQDIGVFFNSSQSRIHVLVISQNDSVNALQISALVVEFRHFQILVHLAQVNDIVFLCQFIEGRHLGLDDSVRCGKINDAFKIAGRFHLETGNDGIGIKQIRVIIQRR